MTALDTVWDEGGETGRLETVRKDIVLWLFLEANFVVIGDVFFWVFLLVLISFEDSILAITVIFFLLRCFRIEFFSWLGLKVYLFC